MWWLHSNTAMLKSCVQGGAFFSGFNGLAATVKNLALVTTCLFLSGSKFTSNVSHHYKL